MTDQTEPVAVVTDFPRKVREIENTWIPMADGTRLAARIWLPEDAEENPVPAILEYLPYRKRDGTVERDALTHPYFAGHGYACLRVDMRGTGDSEGTCHGEYLRQEQDDALEVLDWLEAQPWCTGRVGMIGISWGGFNGLQVAARQHPALQAVVSICSTDDRYADDIHFMGGCALTDKLTWGATAFTIAMTPPDPAIVGHNRWRELWKERLNKNGLWLLEWFRHQRRDDFYKHGSICEDWNKVTVPVYAVGGWADGYTDPVFRLMEHLQGPKKALIGPWAHKYPHFARPGPRIGFLQECLRWWDHWLKDVDTGIMDEPMIRAWLEEPDAPLPYRSKAEGRWVAEPSWPAPETAERTLRLSPGRLGEESGGAAVLDCPQTTGWTSGSWFGFGLVADASLDQSEETGAAIFETKPLREDVELLGHPVLHARVTSDGPDALIAAVLSDMTPDGRGTRVSYGLLNLTHRDSHESPEALTPGQACDVILPLKVCGRRFAKGSRIRLALSNAYWPIVFPSPRPTRLSLDLAKCSLTLPVRAPRDADADLTPFGPPEGAPPMAATVLEPGQYDRRMERGLLDSTQTLRRIHDDGTIRHEATGIVYTVANEDRFTIRADDPASAVAESHWIKRYQREGEWDAGVETHVRVAAEPDAWHVTATLIATDAGSEFHRAEWDERIPRDMV